MTAPGEPDPGFCTGRNVTVTGGVGLLGKPTVRLLENLGAEVAIPCSAELDLTDPGAALSSEREMIGLEARIPFEDGIEETVASFRRSSAGS